MTILIALIWVRVRLVRAGGVALTPEEVHGLSRTLDLWNGIHTSKFTISGKPVMVITCVHPEKDMADVRIESPLLESGELEVAIDFPYPSLLRGKPWSGDFERATGNNTIPLPVSKSRRRADFRR